MPAVTLTDHGSLAGAVELQREARKQGIKPIIGCEVYVADDRHRQEKGYAHLTVLAETNEGYANLIKLSSLGYLEGYYYKPRVDWELLERHAKGLVVLSGLPLRPRLARRSRRTGRRTPPATSTGSSRSSAATRPTSRSRTPASSSRQRINPQLAKLAEATGLPLVATGDVHYLLHEDARAHEALLCIQSGDSLKNPNRWRFDTDQFYFKTPEEMALDFVGYADALRRTLEVAERCNVQIETDRLLLPRFDTPERPRRVRVPRRAVRGGSRRAATTRSRRSSATGSQFELKTIREMGFADYFLIVWDFVHFAKTHGVQVGPGRGSAAGSLAAYCLEITDVDPIRYGLLFERFLNPGRKSMPDMDIDFAVAGRERVINYVAEKYGRDRVAQIITFSTMMARAAVRDAGRVLEIPYGTVDRIAKMIPEGPKVYLDDNLKPGSELQAGLRLRPASSARSSTWRSRSRASSAPTRSTPPASSSPTAR